MARTTIIQAVGKVRDEKVLRQIRLLRSAAVYIQANSSTQGERENRTVQLQAGRGGKDVERGNRTADRKEQRGFSKWRHGNIGILAGEAGRKREKHRGWRNAPRGSLMGGATDKGKALLSCRRDRSPATVIVMRAWLAVASFPPAAHVFKRSCLPCPVWQKHGKTV